MVNGAIVALWVGADMEIEKRWTSKSALNQSPVTPSTGSQMKFWKEGNAEQADNARGSLNVVVVGRDTRTHARPSLACETKLVDLIRIGFACRAEVDGVASMQRKEGRIVLMENRVSKFYCTDKISGDNQLQY